MSYLITFILDGPRCPGPLDPSLFFISHCRRCCHIVHLTWRLPGPIEFIILYILNRARFIELTWLVLWFVTLWLVTLVLVALALAFVSFTLVTVAVTVFFGSGFALAALALLLGAFLAFAAFFGTLAFAALFRTAFAAAALLWAGAWWTWVIFVWKNMMIYLDVTVKMTGPYSTVDKLAFPGVTLPF